MTELKLKRSPLLPSIPKEDEWEKFPRIEQWRRNHMTVMKQLHADAYDDIVAVDTLANSANALANTANAAAAAAAANSGFAGTFFPWEATNTVGTWAATMNANQLLGFYYRNTSNANGNYLRWWTRIPTGTYWFSVLGARTPDGGQFKVYFNTNLIDAKTFEMYAANTTLSYTEVYQMYLANGGLGVFDIMVTGKNASSNGYYLNISQIGFRRA